MNRGSSLPHPRPRHNKAKPSPGKPHKSRLELQVERLEERCVLSGVTGYRSISGVGNNVAAPTEGAAGTDLLRLSPVAYANCLSTPSQPNTLSPREISNNLNNQSNPIFSGADNLGAPQSQDLSDFAYVWGQFIDHDMDLTPTTSNESFPIPADPTRSNDLMGTEAFTRSTFDPATGTSTRNPRQQVNADTSFLDLSQVYGSTPTVANALRTFQGGMLKTSPGGLLPYDNLTYFTQRQLDALNLANDAQQVPSANLFATGDVRGNENIELTAMQTLFVRNHNRIAAELHVLNPTWSDEQLYQEARKINIADEEIITYNEFLPAILGPNALPAYSGYNPSVDPAIDTEFSTVAFRFGHSLLSNSVGRNNNNGTEIADAAGLPGSGAPVNLTADFFDPNLISANGLVDPLTGMVSTGIGAILKADADNAANEMDLLAIDEVRNTLFGVPNAPGTDLIARDIQRARDDGIGTYNQVRVAFGLNPVTCFADITTNVAVQQELQATYGTVDKIDPLEGMFAEDHVPGGDVGPTIKAVLANQFARLRSGDRFFYLNENWTSQEVALAEQADSLAQVIEANTAITNLQNNVFYFKASISGTVFSDPDNDGLPLNSAEGERGLAGFTVNLLDTSGNVLATTTTDGQGHYSFTDQTGIPGTGRFSASIVLPSGDQLTTRAPGVIALSRGGLAVGGVNFGVNGPVLSGAALSTGAASSAVSTGMLVSTSSSTTNGWVSTFHVSSAPAQSPPQVSTSWLVSLPTDGTADLPAGSVVLPSDGTLTLDDAFSWVTL
jgi:hypothetical protein